MYFDESGMYVATGVIDMALQAIYKCLAIRQRAMPNHHYTGLTLHRAGSILERGGKLVTAMYAGIDCPKYHSSVLTREAELFTNMPLKFSKSLNATLVRFAGRSLHWLVRLNELGIAQMA